MQSFSNGARQLGRSLGLLAGLVSASLGLFALQSWLRASGGWALLMIGLVGLWSALLLLLSALQERRRRRRERAVDEALAEIRRAIAAAAPADDEEARRAERR